MQKDGIVFGSIAVLETMVTVSQTNEVFQTIQIIISALAGAVALAYTIWRWYRNAKKDGKTFAKWVIGPVTAFNGTKE